MRGEKGGGGKKQNKTRKKKKKKDTVGTVPKSDRRKT